METTINKSQVNVSLGQISVDRIDSLDGLLAIRNDIDALSDVPFLKSSLMLPWIETFCGSRECRLNFLAFRNEDSKVIGFAPLVVRESLKRGRHLTFIGSGKVCADYMTFPSAPGHESIVAQSAAQWCEENASLWDRIELDGVTTDDSIIAEFTECFENQGHPVEAVKILPSFRMPLPGSWDDILGTLSKNSRKKYRRQARMLDEIATLHRATDAQSLREGMQILESLHTARWNSLGEGGCFASPGFGEFLGAMAEEKLNDGSLSLIWITVEDQPVAADIAYHCGDVMFTYQGGISPDHLNLEPGRAIIKSQIEVAIERGATFMDFLRGDEPYKSRFNTERIENVRYEICGRGTRARMIHSMLAVARGLKSLIG